uniref:DDE_Tnp_1_7 domain-containing protein n=1 Tax=Strongyloides venezuelensis TaxID=75913 RepID=A0A0K0F131_STRVS
MTYLIFENFKYLKVGRLIDYDDLCFKKLSLENKGNYDDEENDVNLDNNFFYVNGSFSSVSSEYESKDTQDSWSHIITKPSRWKFRDPTLCLNKNLVSKCKTPSDYYNLFFYDKMIDFIVQETNRYGPTKDSAFISTDDVEMRKFLAVVIQMSVMPRARFFSSMQSLHVSNNKKHWVKIIQNCEIYGFIFIKMKTMKWYLRIFFVFTQAVVVNAWNNYQPNSGSKIKIVDFKRQIVASILKLEKPKVSKIRHILETVTGDRRVS